MPIIYLLSDTVDRLTIIQINSVYVVNDTESSRKMRI